MLKNVEVHLERRGRRWAGGSFAQQVVEVVGRTVMEIRTETGQDIVHVVADQVRRMS